MKHPSRLLIALMLLSSVWAVSTQSTDPAIIDFSFQVETPSTDDDPPPITVAAVENGDISITLSWQILNGDEQDILLEAYRISEWVTIPKDDDDSAIAYTFDDSRTLDLQHPLNFGLPTYRLSVLDADGERIHERILTIPFAVDDDSPVAITRFEAPLTVNADSLNTVPVTWSVSNRPPNTNLIFEQILADGSTINAENPRATLWIASDGEGSVRLRGPEAGNAVIARLSVVDVLTGDVLDDRGVVIAVVGTPPTADASQPTPRPVNPATSNTGDPLEPGGDPGTINTGNPPIAITQPPGNAAITYQAFANGFMLGNANSRDIWALADTGQVFFYPEINYTSLPANPVTEAPPDGQFMPMGDLGRVWGNYINVRAVLGWATTPEQDYTTDITTVPDRAFIAYILDLPDGQTIRVSTSGDWSFYDPVTGTPIPTVGPIIEQFVTDVPTYVPGEAITVTWSVREADRVILEVYDRWDTASIQAENPALSMGNLPISGSRQITIPADMIGGAQLLLLAFDDQTAPNRFSAPRESLLIPAASGADPTPTVSPADSNTPGAYQPFEDGYMLWREDTGTIYTIIYDGGVIRSPLSSYSLYSNNPVTDEPPPGRVKPVSGFGLVWGNINGVRDALGWGLRVEQGYSMNIRQAATGNSPDDIAIRLPTGTYVVIYGDGTWGYE